MATARVNLALSSYSGLPEAGLATTTNAADTINLNRFSNVSRDVVFLVHNTGGGASDVFFEYTRRGQTITLSPARTVAAGGVYIFGPFSSEFGDHPSADAADGDVYCSSNSASVRFLPIRLPKLVV